MDSSKGFHQRTKLTENKRQVTVCLMLYRSDDYNSCLWNLVNKAHCDYHVINFLTFSFLVLHLISIQVLIRKVSSFEREQGLPEPLIYLQTRSSLRLFHNLCPTQRASGSPKTILWLRRARPHKHLPATRPSTSKSWKPPIGCSYIAWDRHLAVWTSAPQMKNPPACVEGIAKQTACRW